MGRGRGVAGLGGCGDVIRVWERGDGVGLWGIVGTSLGHGDSMGTL